jgi:uncharacterized SAM-binding protein YcdF (DUF218 family)
MNGIINKLVFHLLLFSLLMLFNSCYFNHHATQKYFDKSKSKVFDIVVVPGVPLENGHWSKTMKGRIYWAKYLYDQGIVKNIMFSGSSVYTPYYEGEIMAMYAEALGIPKEHVFSETRAEHSTENIYYSYKKAKKIGFKTFALASDPFQTKTLKRFTRKKVSPDIVLIPMVVDTMKILEPQMKEPFIDYQKAFNKDFISIRKRQSYMKRLQGTIGNNIDKTLYE